MGFAPAASSPVTVGGSPADYRWGRSFQELVSLPNSTSAQFTPFDLDYNGTSPPEEQQWVFVAQTPAPNDLRSTPLTLAEAEAKKLGVAPHVPFVNVGANSMQLFNYRRDWHSLASTEAMQHPWRQARTKRKAGDDCGAIAF